MDPRERLIVALDVASVERAEVVVDQLGDAVTFYKIGYQLAFAGGLQLAEGLARRGKQVFLDLKLHDIGNTVAKGVESVARIGATFLTVHGYPQTMRAAVTARPAGLRVLAVTVLTSYDEGDLLEAGYAATVADLVLRRAKQAYEIGVDGIVCSAEEVSALRPHIKPPMVLVTPGIRPAGAASGDQKRVMTPSAAISAGADYLVVGRPILEASDPRALASAIVADIASALPHQRA
jgi:orotidine-5'-phosphate decarboxylase